MKVTINGLNIIKKWESFRSKPYLDTGNVPTIGYGSTYYKNGARVTMRDKPISQPEALALMEYIANRDFASEINKLVKAEIGQNMFDALVSFTYNVGIAAFAKSTMLKKINALDFVGAANEFPRWNKDNGVVLKGLVSRRSEEKALFEKDILPKGCM